MQLLAELRRRHVFRVAAWYGAAAWLAIQVASTVFPSFNLPPWTTRAVIGAALIGFPFALLLAWVFDVRPDARPAADDTADIASAATWRAPSLWLALAAGALLAFGAQQAWRLVRPLSGERPGIAVLPFDTLGVQENAALVGGLHEAVLDELAALSGLRVIARTSVLHYASSQPDIRQVGRELDVPYVLEGSVQRDGKRLRVHAQLIDARNNEQVWSETYNRDSTDLFGVQSSLARDIAARMEVTLQPAEQARTVIPPTTDAAAYEAYLGALDRLTLFDSKSVHTEYEVDGLLIDAKALLDTALQLDPAFALAHAALSRTSTMMFFFFRSAPGAEEAREAGLREALEALRLQPDLPEGHRELGRYYYWGHFDYENAEKSLRTAMRGRPNDVLAIRLLSWVLRREGRMEDSIALLEQSTRLLPREFSARYDLMSGYVRMHRYRDAAAEATRALRDFPQALGSLEVLADVEVCRTGDLDVAVRAVDRGFGDESEEREWRRQLRWLRGPTDADLAADRAAHERNPDDASARFDLAADLYVAGQRDEAGKVAASLMPMLETRPLSEPEDSFPNSRTLPAAYLFAGRADDAVELAQRHMSEYPVSKNALDGVEAIYQAVLINAQAGRLDEALDLLREYVQHPSDGCAALLRHDPFLAPLRQRPEFERIIAQIDWHE